MVQLESEEPWQFLERDVEKTAKGGEKKMGPREKTG